MSSQALLFGGRPDKAGFPGVCGNKPRRCASQRQRRFMEIRAIRRDGTFGAAGISRAMSAMGADACGIAADAKTGLPTPGGSRYAFFRRRAVAGEGLEPTTLGL